MIYPFSSVVKPTGAVVVPSIRYMNMCVYTFTYENKCIHTQCMRGFVCVNTDDNLTVLVLKAQNASCLKLICCFFMILIQLI